MDRLPNAIILPVVLIAVIAIFSAVHVHRRFHFFSPSNAAVGVMYIAPTVDHKDAIAYRVQLRDDLRALSANRLSKPERSRLTQSYNEIASQMPCCDLEANHLPASVR